MRLVIHAWKWTNPQGACFIYAKIGEDPNSYFMTIGPCKNRTAEAFLRAFQRDELLTEEDADRARRKAEGVPSRRRKAAPVEGGLEFFATCDTWPISVGALQKMIRRGKKVSRKRFLEYVNAEHMRELERQLGYAQHPREGLVMAADQNVEYYLSELEGSPCAFFQWSGIEHVFTPPSSRL